MAYAGPGNGWNAEACGHPRWGAYPRKTGACGGVGDGAGVKRVVHEVGAGDCICGSGGVGTKLPNGVPETLIHPVAAEESKTVAVVAVVTTDTVGTCCCSCCCCCCCCVCVRDCCC